MKEGENQNRLGGLRCMHSGDAFLLQLAGAGQLDPGH
jgi:hypothetical protein